MGAGVDSEATVPSDQRPKRFRLPLSVNELSTVCMTKEITLLSLQDLTLSANATSLGFLSISLIQIAQRFLPGCGLVIIVCNKPIELEPFP